ncbi:877d35ca-67d3-4e98-adf6-2076a6a27c09 [Thermothielavioides terrestris]|jgi:pectinesterase|uniref:Pectinesterase n=2 Tax=Thermothielavioides terrestris TaxID=2587410 RepID=G2QYR6_THETT|nr:carbohydrate esterase family 8 protein [Thermothielavioides terrestris NRRL 8126]AEO66258.1 carbohydrate esterase family 8 protein [Thermothielavioides terrestris NRRL 8126]SPQ25368.1 877d35ca-67d3-4e98-adf6-2076a6a27c09 [Thermothielavioides terrestris]
MVSSLALLLPLVISAAAAPLETRAARTSPPTGCLAVGGSAQYKTVQSAVNALSTSSTTAQCIFIYAGTYNEQVLIPQLKSSLTLYGQTADTSSYSSNTVTITNGLSQDDGLTNDETATLRAHTTNLKVYNINLVNTRGQGSQALALSAYADKQGYYGCQFKGFQDTVLAETGVQVYAKSYIEGATDFIFGQYAQAWFDGVDIRVLAASVGYITANGRDSSTNPSYYVINKSTVAAKTGATVKDGAYYLGRPWRDYARVVFQETSLSSVINPAGWSIWSTSSPQTDHVTFAEYGNSGDGAKGTRASFATKLSAPVSISTVLGSDYQSWVDTSYLS